MKDAIGHLYDTLYSLKGSPFMRTIGVERLKEILKEAAGYMKVPIDMCVYIYIYM